MKDKPGTVKAIKDFISTLGFPIAVAGWLLYERWMQLRDNSDLLMQLTNAITKNTDMVEELIRKVGG